MGILEKGGNAFDAGVATAFTLQVVEPHLNGPGGDVPIIVHDVKRGRTEVICGQGPAPARATIAHYKSEGLDMVPGTGLLAACVPGTFESWMMLLRDYGTMRLRDVLEPAISYARDGYPLVERACATIQTVEQLFRKHWPTSAAVYLPNGEVPSARHAVHQQDAGRDLRPHPERGRERRRRPRRRDRARAKAWSQGFVAEAIDKFCRTQEVMDVSGSPHRGVLSADDMARWQPTVEAPLTYDYGRYTVCKAGVWSQGPVTLQQLALLKGFELDGLDPTGPEFIHLQIECCQARLRRPREVLRRPQVQPTSRSRRCCRMPTTTSGASSITDKASLDFVPGIGRGLWRRRQAAPRRGAARGGRRTRRRRADRRAASARCAATPCISTSSTRPATWCPRRRPAAGCNPRRSFPSSASASAAAPRCSGWRKIIPAALAPGKRPRTDAVADHGAARRRAVSRLGFARRRSAGSVDHAVLPAPRPLQPQSPGGDRRAGLALRAFPDLVLAAHRAPGVLVVENRVPKATIENLRERGHIVEIGPDWSEGRLTARLAGRRAPPRRRQSARHAGLRALGR